MNGNTMSGLQQHKDMSDEGQGGRLVYSALISQILHEWQHNIRPALT